VVAALRWQIEGTRTEIGRTIDAIQARLTPTRLIAEAAGSVKDAAAERVTRMVPTWIGVLDVMWRAWHLATPGTLPTALAGLAAAMVAGRATRGRHHRGTIVLLLSGGAGLLWLVRQSAEPHREPRRRPASS
jgi:hypothetical protein